MSPWPFQRRRRRRSAARRGQDGRGRAGVADWPQLLERDDVLILDTETTGLDRRAEVIEVALINTRGEDLLHRLALPQGSIPREASRIHGLTKVKLKQLGAGNWTELHTDLTPFLEESELVLVYNADFDRRMLKQTCARHDLHLPAVSWRCVLNDYRDWRRRETGARRGNRLHQAYRRECAEKLDQQHRALSDCHMVLALMRAVARKAGPER